MGSLPPTSIPKNISTGNIPKSHTLSEIGDCFQNKLAGMKNKIESEQAKTAQRKEAGVSGLDAFIAEGSDESDDSFEEANDEMAGKSMMAQTDPSKLIDLDLVNLLRYCNELKERREDDEEYQDEVMLKSFQLGQVTKPKLLIFDMDETLVAAKFKGSIPGGFEENFKFPFKDTEISVRLRPYLVDCLEKLSGFYEIIVFTAGE